MFEYKCLFGPNTNTHLAFPFVRICGQQRRPRRGPARLCNPGSVFGKRFARARRLLVTMRFVCQKEWLYVTRPSGTVR